MFKIELLNHYWVDKNPSNVSDLCLHGDVKVSLGDEVILDSFTITGTALYLLRSLDHDHLFSDHIKLLACCANTFYESKDDLNKVIIMDCPNGVDIEIIHKNRFVTLTTENKMTVTIDKSEYTKIVLRFIDEVKDAFYAYSERKIPLDKYERNGYLAFWREWNSLRSKW